VPAADMTAAPDLAPAAGNVDAETEASEKTATEELAAEKAAAEKVAMEKAEQKKELGNNAFKAKKHAEAAALYSEAIEEAGELAPAVYFSNRAICRNALGEYEGACEDASIALLKPDGVKKKTVFTKARAELRLQRPADAEATLAFARKHDDQLAQEVEALLKAEGLLLTPPTAASQGSTDPPRSRSRSPPRISDPPKPQSTEPPRSSETAPPAGAVPRSSLAEAAEAVPAASDQAARFKDAGNVKYKAGAYREALAEYERALAQLGTEDERRVPILGNVAAAYLMLRRVADCISTCGEALEIDASNAKIRARLANAQVARGDFNLARSTLRNAPTEVKDDPALSKAGQQIDEHEKSLAVADAALAAGEPVRAVSLFAELEEKALFDCPSLALRIGRCYLELKKYSRALTTTQQILRSNPRNIDALVLRTEALYRNNEHTIEDRKWPEPMEQGQKLLKEALSGDPDHRVAQALRKRLRSLCNRHEELRLLVHNRELDQARELIDEMVLETADNPVVLARLHCYRALIGTRLKDWKMVIKDVGQALYRDHELVQPYIYRSQAWQNLDRHDDAIKGLEDLFGWHRTEEVYNKIQEAKFLLRKVKRPDYYELLKVPSVASQLEIKKAYRERASEWHPDKKSHLDEDMRKNAEEMFKRIGEAYEVLTSPTKRELYDKGYDLEGMQEQEEMNKRRGHGHGHGHGHSHC